jgi:uncharacterized RDD family membrane protein YckC
MCYRFPPSGEVEMYCPACGERNANGARDCAACGLTLPVDVTPAPAPAQAPQILRTPPLRPAPLRPPSLDPLPPSGRAAQTTTAPAQVRPIIASPTSTAPLSPPASAPVAYSPAPVVHTPAPVVHTPAPVGHTPAPVGHTPAPVVRAPTPVVHTPAPVVHAPTPVVHTPAPVVHAPTPVVHAPAPVVHAPAPVVQPPASVTAPVVGPPTSRRIEKPVPAPEPLRPSTTNAPLAPTKTPATFDAYGPTVLEEFTADEDLFDDNDVTDPGRPHFDDDDAVDVTFTSRTGEGAPAELLTATRSDDDVVVNRPLPRVSFAAPGVVRYAFAALIDGVLAGGPALYLALAVGGDDGTPFLERVIQALLLTPTALVVFVLTAVLISTVAHALLVPRVGATVGGLATGVFLRSLDGSGASPPRAALRGFVTALASLAFLAGPLYALWVDDGRRAIADRLAGTRLVTRGKT